MTHPKDNNPRTRSKVAEQALQVLRDTRAKMDPELLTRMKAMLSPLVKPPEAGTQAKGLQNKNGLFAGEQAGNVETKKAARPSSPTLAASVYGSVQKATESSKPASKENTAPLGPDMEPVDRQKIARIVMKYMELREEKKQGH